MEGDAGTLRPARRPPDRRNIPGHGPISRRRVAEVATFNNVRIFLSKTGRAGRQPRADGI
jgi:hypothetical protein